MKRSTAIVSAVAAMGVGALLATGITSIASAGPTEQSRHGASSEDRGMGQHGMKGDRSGHRHGERHGGTPVRGEHVVQDSTGAFVTYRMIQGTVTAVSASSITVKAADDTTQTYTVGAQTAVTKQRAAAAISEVSVGDTVHVLGKVAGGTATAERIHLR